MVDDLLFHSQLHKDYARHFQRLEGLYSYSPDLESLKKRRGKMASFPHRSTLTRVLKDYNASIEAPGPVMDNIALLGREGTTVLIGGQQAGLCTGPLMTFYKALDIILRAREAERALETPVVPVFWVAGDDHDFSEVNHLYLINSEQEVEKIELKAPFQTRPISQIPCRDSFLQVVEQLGDRVSARRFKDDYLEMLGETCRQADNFGQWFARILTRLLGDRGLILFDPLFPGARELKRSFVQVLREGVLDFKQACREDEAHLRERGYHQQVRKDPSHASFFVIVEGERRPVFREEGRFRSRGGNLDLSPADFWGRLEENPEMFSPDVLLRPVFQEHIFPVLATVNGPGEISYQAQLTSGYRALGLEQPPLFLRRSLTLIEESLLRHLDRWKIKPVRFLEENNIWEELVSRETGMDLEELFGRTRQEVRGLYHDLIQDLKRVHPNLEQLGQKNLRRIIGEVNYLQGRAREFQKEQEDILHYQFTRVYNRLRPRDKMQERVLNLLPFLMRYGPHLITIMARGLEELEGEHGFLTTAGEWK